MIGGSELARGSDDDDGAANAGSKLPNIYLDFNTVYTSLPPNTLGIGFRSFVSPIPVGTQTVMLNAPLTVDLNDRISVYGGISTSMFRTDLSSWEPMILDSWNVGFNADIIQQSGWIPTVTVVSTLTRSITSAPGLASTSNQTIVELDYALDDDATRGLLAGTRLTNVWIDFRIGQCRAGLRRLPWRLLPVAEQLETLGPPRRPDIWRRPDRRLHPRQSIYPADREI